MENWQTVCLIVNSCVALALNLVIFYLVYRKPKLRTSFNATILNACFADIIVSINMFASTIQENSRIETTARVIWCNVTGFVSLLSFVLSVMSLAAVSVNRYFLVCKRSIYDTIFTRFGTTIFILCVWVCSAMLSIPPLVGWGRFSFHEGKSICFADWSSSTSYMIFMISICFCGPITATLTSLYFILRVKRKVGNVISDVQNLNNHAQMIIQQRKLKKDKEERRITLSILAVVFVFFIAWGPFVVVMFLETVGKQSIPHWLDFGALYLGFLNSTANPIVYLSANANFRRQLRSIFLAENSTQNPSTN